MVKHKVTSGKKAFFGVASQENKPNYPHHIKHNNFNSRQSFAIMRRHALTKKSKRMEMNEISFEEVYEQYETECKDLNKFFVAVLHDLLSRQVT